MFADEGGAARVRARDAAEASAGGIPTAGNRSSTTLRVEDRKAVAPAAPLDRHSSVRRLSDAGATPHSLSAISQLEPAMTPGAPSSAHETLPPLVGFAPFVGLSVQHLRQ